jgi:hypothetical protein
MRELRQRTGPLTHNCARPPGLIRSTIRGNVPRMTSDKVRLPTREAVAEACDEFGRDGETKILEAALTDLFSRYPDNTDEAQVLLKVVTLNQLYSTRLPTRAPDRPNVFDVARCIPALALDQGFSNASLDVSR